MAQGRRAKRGEVPSEDKKRISKKGLKNIWGIFSFILPYKWTFLLGMVFLLLSTVATLTFPYFLGELIDSASPFSILEPGASTTTPATESSSPENSQNIFAPSQINQVAIALVIVLALQGLFSFMRIYLFAQVSERGMADIRSTLYEKIMSLPMIFFEQKRVGELTSRISSDVTQLQDMLSYVLAEFLRQVLTLIIGIVLISWVSPQL